MIKDKDLIERYQSFYEKIRELVGDNEIFPPLDSADYEEYVSSRNWLGIPSFAMSKRDMTNSDNAHISLRIDKNNLTADLFFNGVKAVKRFMNILHPLSKKERDEFIQLIKNLDEKYSIIVQYDTRVPRAPASWIPIKTIKCHSLSENDIQELLKTIKETKERRDLEQKEFGTKKVVTMSICVGRVEIKDYTDNDLKEIFSNLASIARNVHDIKTVRKINKIERGIPKLISNLEGEISNDEIHLEKMRGLKEQKTLGFENVNLEELEDKLNKKKNKLTELKKGNITISKPNE